MSLEAKKESREKKMRGNKNNMLSEVTEDIILKIFWKLEEDPRHWARLACVCTKFNSLIRDFCWKNKCSRTIPSDLLSATDPPLSLHKLTVCCPGLHHAGLLFDNFDAELGPEQPLSLPPPSRPLPPQQPKSDSYWSLYDDLYHDALYAASESQLPQEEEHQPPPPDCSEDVHAGVVERPCKKWEACTSWNSHLASGSWNLSREQGGKLLARQFRDDCLYVCDWPGCVHSEEKRKYRLFRGVFKNFKKTRVWRTINDGNRKKLELPCAFCNSQFTWDLHSAFCLRRGFGFHDDGEPVVRAYVCDNGHVSGAWTDVPMYT